MNAIEIERAAYLAAHRILSSNTSTPELSGCHGARRWCVVETIAGVIKDVLELYNSECPHCWERTHNVASDPKERRRTAVVLEFPRRVSS